MNPLIDREYKSCFIDSHCHLEDDAYDFDRDEVYRKALKNNVGLMILAGSDIKTSSEIVELTAKYEGLYGVVGVHPHEAGKADRNYLYELEKLLLQPKILGIGEIGLDYYYNNSPTEIQKQVFLEQLDLAAILEKPFVIHSREASFDTLEIIKKKGYHKGLFHCYSYSLETLDEIISLGYHISLGGAVTFKNAKKPVEVAAKIPLNRLLLETDAPYLTPVPFRGQRNEPSYVVEVAKRIAAIKGLTTDEVAKATYNNTLRFYQLS